MDLLGPILVPGTVPCARYRARGGRTPNWGLLLLLEGGVGRGGSRSSNVGDGKIIKLQSLRGNVQK